MERIQIPEAIVDFECDPIRYAGTWWKGTGGAASSPWYSEREKAYFDLPRRFAGTQIRCEIAPCHAVHGKKFVFADLVLKLILGSNLNRSRDVLIDYRDCAQVGVKHARMMKKQVLRRITGVSYRQRTLGSKLAIEGLFAVRNRQEVSTFLRESPFLIMLILEARIQIAKYFPESELHLETISDPEGLEPSKLFLYISTNESPRDARPKLKSLDKEWWLAALDRAQGKLCISLEYQ